uniref:Gustatory receptor n=1 Tax=Sipha flava TaxID=143950 RepID=A0A2S2R4N9_9HEMI
MADAAVDSTTTGASTAAAGTGALTWPVTAFWNACGVFLADLSYNRFSPWFSAVLLASGVLNIVITPWSLCALDGWCEDVMSTTYRQLYTRLVAFTSLMSRASIMYKVYRHMAEYRWRQEGYERKWPLSGVCWRQNLAYATFVVTTCLMLMIPINMLRLYLFYMYEVNNDNMLLLFFFNMYLQNWSMCCMETHFALLCFRVYLHLRSINDELLAVRTDIMVSNRYPVALRSMRPSAMSRCRRSWRRRRFAADEDHYHHRRHQHHDYHHQHHRAGGDDHCDVGGRRGGEPVANSVKRGAVANLSFLQDPLGCPLETTIEMLRVRHGLMRESIDYLNNIFGCQLTLSLVALCVMMLFDIYNEAFHAGGSTGGIGSPSRFIYFWVLQYMFRFFVIIMTAHSTTQEGYKSKTLVTEINNRYLNSNTKYELQLFLKQMNHHSIDITACDCFTLNSHLVASVS